MCKNYIFFMAIFLSIHLQGHPSKKQKLDTQTQLYILTLHPQEKSALFPDTAGPSSITEHFLANYDNTHASLAALLISDGAQVDTPDIMEKIEHNRKYLPKTYRVIQAGKIVQSWNPPLPPRPDGSPYSYKDLVTMQCQECSEIENIVEILDHQKRFGDAVLLLQQYSNGSCKRYFK